MNTRLARAYYLSIVAEILANVQELNNYPVHTRTHALRV